MSGSSEKVIIELGMKASVRRSGQNRILGCKSSDFIAIPHAGTGRGPFTIAIVGLGNFMQEL